MPVRRRAERSSIQRSRIEERTIKGPTIKGPTTDRGMPTPKKAIVVGGGIAGLAAALRLAEHGMPVTLFERREVLGGRASSFPLRESAASGDDASSGPGRPDEATGEPDTAGCVDNCQHVLMRCCVNLLDFYHRIGAGEAVVFYDRFQFVDRENRWSTLAAHRWLPAPLHLIPSLLRFRSMGARDKVGIAAAMIRMMFLPGSALQDYGFTFGDWLARTGQTKNAIACFWRPVIVSALNEQPERVAAPYAFQLFREAFLRNRYAFEMGLPGAELAEIYSDLGSAALASLGVRIVCGARVTGIEFAGDHVVGVKVAGVKVAGVKVAGVKVGDAFEPADLVVCAVPPSSLPPLLPEEIRRRAPFAALSGLGHSPITGIHLWYDRPVADRPHVALLGRQMQWIFAKDLVVSQCQHQRGDGTSNAAGSYLGLVVSASRDLTALSRSEIVALAVEAVEAVFPRARKARLKREVVIREPRATFSPAVNAEALRPPQKTGIHGLYLTGDWTRSGWPATMEGAVRSGYLAAQAVLEDSGIKAGLLQPELPADLLPRWLGL